MFTAVFLQILQSLAVIALAPLYSGTLARAEAIVASERGPSVIHAAAYGLAFAVAVEKPLDIPVSAGASRIRAVSDAKIARCRLRPAAVRNWRAFGDAARSQNVFSDIPIIEAGFWLTAAGRAR